MRTTWLAIPVALAFTIGVPSAAAQSDINDEGTFERTTNTGGNFFNEDVQIRGDLCVGSSCTDGENVPLGTLRIDSDIAWIAINDSSTIAGFPTNDWEIRVNDSSNGGEDYFTVRDTTGGKQPFTIEAGAGNDAIVVNDDSKVGIGTADPAEELHVATAELPRIRLEDTSGSGNLVWDIGMTGSGDLIFRDGSNKVQLRVFTDGRIRYNPADSAPSGASNLGDIYNDTSGALCWYDGSAWQVVAGTGTCV